MQYHAGESRHQRTTMASCTRPLSRRQFLAGMATLAAGSILAACGSLRETAPEARSVRTDIVASLLESPQPLGTTPQPVESELAVGSATVVSPGSVVVSVPSASCGPSVVGPPSSGPSRVLPAEVGDPVAPSVCIADAPDVASSVSSTDDGSKQPTAKDVATQNPKEKRMRAE